jgi:peptidyl-prolyl cis-trans isomerase B (cyclophilin B)
VPTDKRARQRAARYEKQAKLQRQRKRRQMIRRGVSLVILAAAIVLVIVLVSSSSPPKNKVAGNTGHSTTTTSTSVATSTTTAPGTPPSAPDQTGGTLKSWSCPKANGSSPHILHFPKTEPPMCIDPAKTYTATLATTEGKITFVLDTKHTPLTANNFVVLSLYHYYDGTSIDRIDTSIDIEQTGSPSTQNISDPGPGYTIKDEGSHYKYHPGDVVMARSGAPNSGAAQYFFVYGPKAAALDSQGTYVTFGHVTGNSLSVLRKIASLYEPCPASDSACLGGAPKSVVLIQKVTITAS